MYRSITCVVPGDGASTSLWFDSWSVLGPLASALPAAFSHCISPDATLAESVGGAEGSVIIPVWHRLSAQVVAEPSFVRSQLHALRLALGADRRLVSLGSSEEFHTGYVYRALHALGCVVPH
jgi:hypothetical protein